MKRRFSDFVPTPATLRKRLTQVLSGGTVATLSLASGSPSEAKTIRTDVDTTSAKIVNRNEKGKKLLLRMPDGSAYRMLQHRSHSSHASHASHASHYSGSSGGGSSTTPAPRTATPAFPPPARPAAQPTAEARTSVVPAIDQSFEGTVELINLGSRTFELKFADGRKYLLAYRDDTIVKMLNGTETRLDDSQERNNGRLPFEKGEKLRVKWKAGPTGNTIATVITHVQ